MFAKRVCQKKVKVCIQSQVAHQAGAYPGFSSMKRLGVFLLPPGWDASQSRGLKSSIKFCGTHLYIWVERGTLKVKFLAQEQGENVPGVPGKLAPKLSLYPASKQQVYSQCQPDGDNICTMKKLLKQ